jgi:hypothetical protein
MSSPSERGHRICKLSYTGTCTQANRQDETIIISRSRSIGQDLSLRGTHQQYDRTDERYPQEFVGDW